MERSFGTHSPLEDNFLGFFQKKIVLVLDSLSTVFYDYIVCFYLKDLVL
jgi:hypothetical protein